MPTQSAADLDLYTRAQAPGIADIRFVLAAKPWPCLANVETAFVPSDCQISSQLCVQASRHQELRPIISNAVHGKNNLSSRSHALSTLLIVKVTLDMKIKQVVSRLPAHERVKRKVLPGDFLGEFRRVWLDPPAVRRHDHNPRSPIS